MFQKLRDLAGRGVKKSREAGRKLVERGIVAQRDPEAYEGRRKEKQEAREALQKSTAEMRKAWAELPAWPNLMPAFLMLAGFAALIVWVLTNG